ncbi:MAG: PAS domain S-box protein, partial [Anaerolineae bacterium]
MIQRKLSDLLDMTAVQKMAEANYQAVGMPIGIIDARDGSVLVGTGWQDICSRFHRANPESLKRCEDSDRLITDQLSAGEARQYKCLNGLWDIGIPIMVAGQHLATLFLGQFFYEGEVPDREFFIRQAQEFGYDLSGYLAALARVRVFSREKVDYIVAYNKALAGFIADLAEQAMKRVKADEDLQFANTLLHTQIETSLDGVLVVNAAGKIISYNQRFMDMWQIPPEVMVAQSDELAMQAVSERLVEPTEFRARVEYLYQHHAERSQDEIRLKDGLTFERYSAPIFGRDGSYYGRVWYVRDVTDQKRAEEKLKTSLSQQIAMLNGIPDLAWLKDTGSRYIAVNEPFGLACGVAPHEVVGKNDFDIWSAELAAQYQVDDREVMDTNRSKRIEERVIQHDGHERWLETIRTPIVDAQGQVTGTVGIGRDITERKRVEEELRESRNLLQAVLDTIPARVFWKDHNLNYLGCNQPFALDAGARSPEDVIGKDDYQLGWREQAELYRSDDQRVIKSATPKINYEELQTTPDGRHIWLRTNKVPLQDEDGTVWGVLGTYEDITERKAADEAVRESEEKYRRLVEVSPIAMWIIGHDRIVRYMNPAALRILGANDLQQVVGRTAFDFIHPDYHAIVIQRMSELVEHWQSVPLIAEKYVRLDGSLVDVEVVATPFTAAGISAMQVLFQDITERKQAEEALRASEERFRALVETTSDWIWEINEKGVYTYSSPKVKDILGYEPSEVVGQTPFDFMPSDESTRIAAIFNRVIDQRLPVIGLENINLHKDGRQIALETNAMPILNSSGRLIGYRGIDRDVTERKQAEEALRRSEMQLRLITDNMIDVVSLTDAQFNLIYVSPSMERIFGYSPQNSIGQSITKWVHPDDLPTLIQASTEARQVQASSLRLVYRCRHADGRYIWTESAFRLLYDEQGKSTGAIFSSRDITERKRAEDALQETQFFLNRSQQVARIGSYKLDVTSGAWISSPSLDDILGITSDFPKTVAGWVSLIWQDDRDMMQDHLLRHVLTNHQRFEKEYRIIRPSNGQMCWVFGLGELEFDASGQPIRMIGTIQDINERKLAEAALQQAALIVENSPVMLFRWRAAKGWPVVLVSQNVVQFGYTPEELLNGAVAFSSIIHPDDLEQVSHEVQTYTASGVDRFQQEYRILTKDGQVRWVDDRTAVERDSTGQVTHYQGIVVDITERKQTEAALRASEAKLQLTLEAARLGDWSWDIATGEVVWSAQCKALYGLPSDAEVSYDRFLERVHPDHREYVVAALKQAVETRGDYDVEKRVVWPDGSTHWTASRGRVFCDTNGQPVRLVGVTLDITDRKQVDEALRESQWMLRSVLDQFPGVVFWKDRQSVYLGCNRAFSTAAGLADPEEIVGKTDFDLPWAETEAINYRADDSAVMSCGQPRLNIVESQHQADGRIAWFDTSKVPLSDAQGIVFGVLGTSRDITEHVHTVQTLRETEVFLNKSQQGARIGSYKFDLAYDTWISSPSLDDILGIDQAFPKTAAGWLSLVLPEDRDMMQDHLLRHVLAERQRFEKEYRIVRPRDGQLRWMFGLGELDLDSDDRPIRMIGTIQDITERKQAEEALRLSEERYRILAQNLPDSALILFDRELRFIVADGPEIGAIGFSREMLEGKTLHDAMPAAIAQLMEPDIRRTLDGDRFEAELPYEDRFYRYTYVPIRDEVGQVILGMILSTNITERKRAEDTLRKSEERFRSLIKNSSDVTSVLSMDGTATYQSPALKRVLGYDAEQFTGINEFDYVHPDDKETTKKAFITVTKQPDVAVSAEYRFQRADGSWAYLESIISNHLDDHSIKGIVLNSRDITERKRVEAQLERNLQETRVRFEVSQGLAGKETEEEVLDTLIQLAGFYPEVFVVISTFNQQAGELIAVVRRQSPFESGLTAMMSVGDTLSASRYPLVNRFFAERTFVSNDIQNDERFELAGREILRQTGAVSFAAMPFAAGKEWLGYMTVMAKSHSYFDEEKQHLYETLAEQGAVALRAARLRNTIRESQQRLSLLIQQSPLAIIEWDLAMNVVSWNPAANRIFGYTAEEAIGQPIDLIVPKDVRSQIDPVWQTILTRKDAVYSTNDNVTKDERLITCEWFNAPLISTDGQVMGVVSFAQDITERKQMDAKLRTSEARYRALV